MSRPSMAAQRAEEILDALEICIIERGIQATSLENIAEKAGLKRSVLRHYIGNRDEIICALSARWSKIHTTKLIKLLDQLPDNNRCQSLIEAIFIRSNRERVNNTIIGEALFFEAKRLPSIRQDQEKIIANFIKHIGGVITAEYPNADTAKIELVSHGIYANYLLAESLLPLELINQIHKLKQSSKLLFQGLEQD